MWRRALVLLALTSCLVASDVSTSAAEVLHGAEESGVADQLPSEGDAEAGVEENVEPALGSGMAENEPSTKANPVTPESTVEANVEPTSGSDKAEIESPSTTESSTSDGSPRLRFGLALRAARPWSFPATVSPVMYGSALAFHLEDRFQLPALVLTLVTTLGVHAAGNLMNTLFDFENRVDTPASSDLTLVKGLLTPSQVRKLIMISYVAAAGAVALVPAVSNAPLSQIALLFAAGASSAYTYSGGPGLKYKALGDVLISLTFGPLLVGFSYLVQVGRLSWAPMLASLPLAAHLEAILHANNARDIDEDRANGVKTLASFLGLRRSLGLYAALVSGPFAYALVRSWQCSALSALPLLSVPAAVSLVRDFAEGRLARLPMRTAKFQFLFGTLMSLSVLLPSPSLRSFVGKLFGH